MKAGKARLWRGVEGRHAEGRRRGAKKGRSIAEGGPTGRQRSSRPRRASGFIESPLDRTHCGRKRYLGEDTCRLAERLALPGPHTAQQGVGAPTDPIQTIQQELTDAVIADQVNIDPPFHPGPRTMRAGGVAPLVMRGARGACPARSLPFTADSAREVSR